MFCLLRGPGASAKVGVVLDGLEPPNRGQQLGLFAPAASPVAVSAAGHPALMAALDLLNGRFGRGTVRVASAVSAGQSPPWQGLARWRSGAFTARLEDLLTVS